MPKQLILAIDLALVALFAAIGVVSHHESLAARWAVAAWPFLLACLVAWLILLVRRRPVGTIAAGVFIWLVTAWGGLALRAASHGGMALSFCIVATAVTGFFLLGWRALAHQRLAA